MCGFLNRVRARPESRASFQHRLFEAAPALLFGAAAGVLAKHFDNAPVIGALGTNLGIWILSATLLAAWSRSPAAAALRVFLFFAAMLAGYYLYSALLFGFFPTRVFLAWSAIALLSPAAAYLAWYARGSGWPAAWIASLPTALLLLEGYSFLYTGALARGLSLLGALLLVLALGGRSIRQSLRILVASTVMFLLLRQLDLFALVFSRI